MTVDTKAVTLSTKRERAGRGGPESLFVIVIIFCAILKPFTSRTVQHIADCRAERGARPECGRLGPALAEPGCRDFK
eukprot:7243163-Prymnesium_polylepis.1